MYRKEIKVLDCTIRDGGLMNNHLFSDEIVRGVFHAVNESAVDYIELGYKADENQFKRGEYGPMKFCSEKDLENVIGDTKLNCKVLLWLILVGLTQAQSFQSLKVMST